MTIALKVIYLRHSLTVNGDALSAAYPKLISGSDYMRVTPARAIDVCGVKEKVKGGRGVNLMGENYLLVSPSLFLCFFFLIP